MVGLCSLGVGTISRAPPKVKTLRLGWRRKTAKTTRINPLSIYHGRCQPSKAVLNACLK